MVRVGQCSGAIIHRSLVVVPGHCLDGKQPREITWHTASGKQVELARVDRCWTRASCPNHSPECDIGVCSLLDPVREEAVAKVGDVSYNAEPTKTQVVQVVGYRDHKVSARGENNMPSRIGSPPSRPGVSLGRIIQVPTAFTISVGTGKNSACFGDSGSAVFAKTRDGRNALLGLISGPESGVCRGRALAVRIKPHLTWLEATTGQKLATE